MTGHHRRHNPVMHKAKEIIESGKLGRVLVVNAMFWLFKPDDYFDISWRRERGAGPVFLNLIHDVDNLRYLFGDVAAVQARESNAVRGNAVEETARGRQQPHLANIWCSLAVECSRSGLKRSHNWNRKE
ncbi:putative oxidoreductase protein (plasmid) [Sinorhizobium sojae CCBAU 05684]|uniref:Putative oxidoreductase protein n=1 Tax=Sinorhizobium sojae CCBAU 05684 TaxID=716928 RepID=A0A249PK98_9HYPH|nr:putative oxidoreductase protein [Sinorhizobium sojae CCBAU 05684]